MRPVQLRCGHRYWAVGRGRGLGTAQRVSGSLPSSRDWNETITPCSRTPETAGPTQCHSAIAPTRCESTSSYSSEVEACQGVLLHTRNFVNEVKCPSFPPVETNCGLCVSQGQPQILHFGQATKARSGPATNLKSETMLQSKMKLLMSPAS